MAVFLGCINHRGGNDFEGFFPGGASQPALASGFLVIGADIDIFNDSLPSIYRVGIALASRSPCISKDTTDIGVFYSDGTINVPGEGNSALATARLVGGQALIEVRIVQSLHLPCDDTVLDIHLPGAATSAVNPVCATDNLVVLPAVTV